MRKVNVDAVVEIMVPFKVRLDVLVRADDGASVGEVLRKWAHQNPEIPATHADGDVEVVTIQKIENISGIDPNDDEALEVALRGHLNGGGLVATFLEMKVTDTR